MPATKNPCAKTVKPEDAYEVWETRDGSWTWRVLKKYQLEKLSITRWVASIPTNDFQRPRDPISDPSSWLMSLCPQFEVGVPIIIPNSVDVMNALIREQRAPQALLHDQPVFGYVSRVSAASLDENMYVPISTLTSTTSPIPRILWCPKATSLAAHAASVLHGPTFADILAPSTDASATLGVSGGASVLFAAGSTLPDLIDSSADWIRLSSHINTIIQYSWEDQPYARAFCHVTSPYCPDGELGDTYIADYKRGNIRIK